MFPEAKYFIQTIYIDHPLIKQSKTADVAVNIVNLVKQFKRLQLDTWSVLHLNLSLSNIVKPAE